MVGFVLRLFFKFLVLISACSQHLNCTKLTRTSRPDYTTRSLVASILVDFLCGETRTVCARPVLKTCISMRLFTVQFSLHAVNTPLVFFRSYYAASHKCGLLLCYKLHGPCVCSHHRVHTKMAEPIEMLFGGTLTCMGPIRLI